MDVFNKLCVRCGKNVNMVHANDERLSTCVLWMRNNN